MDEQERQDGIKELHAKLDVFLKTFHEYDDYVGFILPQPEEQELLASILDELLELKFGADADGWLSVTWQLTYRAIHRRPHFLPMQAVETKGDNTVAWFNEQERRALMNVKYAIKEWERLQRVKEFYPFPKDEEING